MSIHEVLGIIIIILFERIINNVIFNKLRKLNCEHT